MEQNLSSVNMEDVKNNNYEDLIFDFLEDDDDEDDDVKKIIREAKKKIKIPTLDDLLEKIHENGLESLTIDELKILKKHTK